MMATYHSNEDASGSVPVVHTLLATDLAAAPESDPSVIFVAKSAPAAGQIRVTVKASPAVDGHQEGARWTLPMPAEWTSMTRQRLGVRITSIANPADMAANYWIAFGLMNTVGAGAGTGLGMSFYTNPGYVVIGDTSDTSGGSNVSVIYVAAYVGVPSLFDTRPSVSWAHGISSVKAAGVVQSSLSGTQNISNSTDPADYRLFLAVGCDSAGAANHYADVVVEYWVSNLDPELTW